MSDTLLQSTLRELRALLLRPRLWLVFALVVGLFVLTGPFGTYERLAFPTRLGYWLVLHAVTWACALTCIVFFDAALGKRLPSRMSRMLVGAAFAALPVGLAITVINFALLMRPLNLERIVENALVSLPISIAFCLLTWLSLSGSDQADPEAAPGTAEPPALDGARAASIADAPAAQAREAGTGRPDLPDRPALLDRLPANKRGTLIRLEVQDHYVLAVTSRGTDLLLMRLGDAINETGNDTGQQIHRSHWVSDAGVRKIIRQGGKNPRLAVETVDGQTLPVSRSQLAEVRARWADRMDGA
ncbi:LytTR family DNA-binding domain-containing protein [Hoeflea sp. EC-HK425]|uniref:LytTR family DNA-binding domain-containing protein n=1 Tax=Hoeflea sp. EC-HK425 TaxID=2038388 RepID=UPI00125BF554|nr:LytTR family DNA-binding domain-containing protein [Hoeflea sp. EC-HK425]VVT04644.1 Response regulator of the LytR/AlgR family [Hoeflea sp. EC-HK425]